MSYNLTAETRRHRGKAPLCVSASPR